MTNKDKTIKYFRQNIAQAKLAYEVWKMTICALDAGLVGDYLAKKYKEIQEIYPLFFASIRYSSISSCILSLYHVFDPKYVSMYKIDKDAMKKFYKENRTFIEKIEKWRHEIFAHKNDKFEKAQSDLAVSEMDLFFENLEKFYNEITSKEENSHTLFEYGLDIRREVESLYQDIKRGRDFRISNSAIEYDFIQNNNIISKKLYRLNEKGEIKII